MTKPKQTPDRYVSNAELGHLLKDPYAMLRKGLVHAWVFVDGKPVKVK